MTKWEYKNETIIEGTDIGSILNTRGKEGWELVAIAPHGRAFIFKRPLKKKNEEYVNG